MGAGRMRIKNTWRYKGGTRGQRGKSNENNPEGEKLRRMWRKWIAWNSYDCCLHSTDLNNLPMVTQWVIKPGPELRLTPKSRQSIFSLLAELFSAPAPDMVQQFPQPQMSALHRSHQRWSTSSSLRNFPWLNEVSPSSSFPAWCWSQVHTSRMKALLMWFCHQHSPHK